ncbi:endolytic transglycosylase MltG [Planctobacterium marinum]|uniref:Endolytic murein transglycosylase n=1 Tax=Planctobacterium marinum TaxID=1631968 RepID=A0AA48HQ45_9ALTE|nr:aminodeoxychorismate lyase [Planctobacterium marinum]
MIKRGLWITIVGLTALLSIAVVYWQFNQPVQQILKLEQESTLNVAKGQSLLGLVSSLAEKGLIEHSFVLKLYLRLYADKYPIKQGHYAIKPDATLLQLLSDISQGKEKTYSVTMIEGLTWKQWYAQLEKLPFITMDSTEAELLAMLEEEAESLEGLLLPETYQLSYNTSLSSFVSRMYQNMQSFLAEQWDIRQGMLPLNNPYEALILASIIEKETGVAIERPRISAVFINRLNDGMRLQTDPTVIYGLGEQFDGNLTRQHLRQKTRHNTYVIKGLPPTPIAMPGKESIIAALNPADTNEYYFVSKGDGSHQFSETLQQHNAAVRKYQLGL